MSLISRGTFAATVLVTLAPDLSGNFVATGAADQVEINAAIVYCAAIGGGEVAIGYGGWTLAATVNVPAGVLLRGMGWTTILNYNAGGNCITFTGDNAKVRDLKIVITAGAGGAGTRPNGIIADTRTNLEVSGVWFIGDQTVNDANETRQNGIFFDTVTESKIINNRLTHARFHPIALVSSDENIITDNYCGLFDVSRRTGIQLSASIGNVVSNNQTHDNDPAGISFLAASNHNICTGNFSTTNTQNGIYVDESYGNTVTGNTCQDNTMYGIKVEDSFDTTVTGNTCTENGLQGIHIDNSSTTVTGNTCNKNTEHGIRIRDADNCTVTGNTCNENVEHGIYADGSSNNTIVGNTCYGNDSGNTSTFDGIHITAGSDDNIIHTNTCNDNDRYGINIAHNTALRNWVKNNQLRGNTTGAFNDVGVGTKTAFINVLAPNPDAFIGTHAVQQMADDIDSLVRFEVPFPREFQEIVTAQVLLVSAASGDLRRVVATNWGQFGSLEAYNTGSDAIAAGQVAVLVDDMTAIDISAAFTGAVGEDWVGVEFTREASNVNDTIDDTVYFVGFRMRYV